MYLRNIKNQRQLRIGERIKRILAEYFCERDFFDTIKPYNDEILKDFENNTISVMEKAPIVITQVQVSKDLLHARVFIYMSYKNNEQTTRFLLNILNSKLGKIRHFLARNLGSKFTPSLKFEIDKSIEYQELIEKIIKNLNN